MSRGHPDDTSLREGLAADLRTLAGLHDREPTAALLDFMRTTPAHHWLALDLEGRTALSALELMDAGLRSLPETIGAAQIDALASDFADIYLIHACRAAPSESPWFDDDGLERQAAMFAVRGWYGRHGLAATDWRKRPDDHLVTELEFLAHVIAAAPAESWIATAAAFLDDHLLRWVPRFAARVSERCATRYFAGAALLTQGYLEELRDLLAALGAPARAAAPDPGAPCRSAAVGCAQR